MLEDNIWTSKKELSIYLQASPINSTDKWSDKGSNPEMRCFQENAQKVAIQKRHSPKGQYIH